MLGKPKGTFSGWRKRSGDFVRLLRTRFISVRPARKGHSISSEPLLDARRRAFLKYAAFGSALFVAGKYVDPLMNTLRGDTVLSEKTFENFKVTETGKQLLVTDDDGGEILTIDKESF